MEPKIFTRLREGLLHKRENLIHWLSSTPPQEKRIRLGPYKEGDVRDQVRNLEIALAKEADHSLGICQVCQDLVETELLQMDYSACVCLAHLSQDEIRKLETELELSQSVQRALLPQTIPAIPGMEIAVFSRPAMIVGGDYFDFNLYQDGSHALAIADVMGHGVSAGLIMASVQTALRTLIPESNTPSEILLRFNRFFLRNINFTTFVTVFLARFEPETGVLDYSNAGHTPPLLIHNGKRSSNSITWLNPNGAAIGLMEQYEVAVSTIPLSPGDILLLYTDGVTEAMNPSGMLFGRDRLVKLAEREASSTSRDLVSALRAELNEFTAGTPMADDTTLVVLKVA